MADDTLLTIWKIAAPIEDVWEAIAQAERWPSWWKGVEKVEQLEPGDEHGIGRVIRSTRKSKLPYRLAFESRTVKVRKPHTIEIEAIGELKGSGRWELSQADSANRSALLLERPHHETVDEPAGTCGSTALPVEPQCRHDPRR